jgi:hypothetical protein
VPESPGIDPCLTMFIHCETGRPTLELAFGRNSTVAPIEDDLLEVGLNPDHYATDPDMEDNPDPNAQRPDQNFLDLGFTSATEFVHVGPDNIVTIDIGPVFELLSEDIVTPAFKNYMMSFKWRINLQDFRMSYLCWDQMQRGVQEDGEARAAREALAAREARAAREAHSATGWEAERPTRSTTWSRDREYGRLRRRASPEVEPVLPVRRSRDDDSEPEGRVQRPRHEGP